MQSRQLKLADLKIKSFITEIERAESLQGGIYCPPTSWYDTYCPTTEPHDNGCASTGTGDDPTGLLTMNIELC